MTATHHRSQMMRNFGIREADLTSLEITITEEINPSAINTKWETAIAEAVGGYSPWTIVPMEERRTSAVIKATLARDRLLRTMEICGHIPRWEPPVIQAAPAPTPVIQPSQAAPAPQAAPAVQAAPVVQAAPAVQAVQVNPHPIPPREYARNPLTRRQILKSGALYKKLQRQGKIPDDPQTPRQRANDRNRAWRAARSASLVDESQGPGISWDQWLREYDLACEPQLQQQQQQWEQRRRRRVEAAAAGALSHLEAQRTAAREQRPTEQPTEPCAICMDDTYTDPLRLRECGHTYCYECIKHWHTSRHGRAKCPTCRTDIQRNPALA